MIIISLQKFKGVGITKRLISQFYSQLSTPENKFIPVRIWGIVMVLSILGGGVVLSVVILVIEITTYQNKRLFADETDQMIVKKNLVLARVDTNEKEQFFKYR